MRKARRQCAIPISLSRMRSGVTPRIAASPLPKPSSAPEPWLPTATPDEQLLVNWLLDVQEANNLAAISAMNDLRARFPTDKHILYLTAEWLYFQQDYSRSKKMMKRILDIDPNFPPALNMLGYSYVESGDPDPAKAVNYLKRYASLEGESAESRRFSRRSSALRR